MSNERRPRGTGGQGDDAEEEEDEEEEEEEEEDGSKDSTVRLWEVESGRLVRTLAGHTGSVCTLAGLPGGLVASGPGDRTVAVWRVVDANGGQ